MGFCPSICCLRANQFFIFGVFVPPRGSVFQFFLEMAGDEWLEIWFAVVARIAMVAVVLIVAMVE